MTKERVNQMAFRFNATSQEVTSLLIENEPFFVAKDVCDILELGNVTKALYGLDDDEKLTLQLVRAGQNRKVNCINESGLYALILRSNKPEAKVFRKWVTSEVLPAIRKRGYYGKKAIRNSFIDARDVPYKHILINGVNVRCITLEDVKWYSINDIHLAINSTTKSDQAAKRLNIKQKLAQKIFLFGNTHPAWFTNDLGVNLLASGSRILKANQLTLFPNLQIVE